MCQRGGGRGLNVQETKSERKKKHRKKRKTHRATRNAHTHTHVNLYVFLFFAHTMQCNKCARVGYAPQTSSEHLFGGCATLSYARRGPVFNEYTGRPLAVVESDASASSSSSESPERRFMKEFVLLHTDVESDARVYVKRGHEADYATLLPAHILLVRIVHDAVFARRTEPLHLFYGCTRLRGFVHNGAPFLNMSVIFANPHSQKRVHLRAIFDSMCCTYCKLTDEPLLATMNRYAPRFACVHGLFHAE